MGCIVGKDSVIAPMRQKSTRMNTGLTLFPMAMMLITLLTCNLEASTM